MAQTDATLEQDVLQPQDEVEATEVESAEQDAPEAVVPEIDESVSADTPYYIPGTNQPAPTQPDNKTHIRYEDVIPNVESVDDVVNTVNGVKSIVIYKYDTISGELLQAIPVEADNHYVVPGYHTTIKPLEAKENFAICFNQTTQSWEYIPDYRGRKAWSTKTGLPLVVFNLKVENATDKEPAAYSKWDNKKSKWVPDEKKLEEARKAKLLELTNYFLLKQDSLSVNVEGVGEVNSGYTAYLNIMALISQANGQDVDFMLYNNTTVKVNTTKLESIKSAIEKNGIELHKKKWELRTRISSATSVADLNAIEISI